MKIRVLVVDDSTFFRKQLTKIIEADPDTTVDEICQVMGRTPPWIPGLNLRADGYECQFYRKD